MVSTCCAVSLRHGSAHPTSRGYQKALSEVGEKACSSVQCQTPIPPLKASNDSGLTGPLSCREPEHLPCAGSRAGLHVTLTRGGAWETYVNPFMPTVLFSVRGAKLHDFNEISNYFCKVVDQAIRPWCLVPRKHKECLCAWLVIPLVYGKLNAVHKGTREALGTKKFGLRSEFRHLSHLRCQ